MSKLPTLDMSDFEEVLPDQKESGIREGGTQVNITHSGLVSIGSGLIDELGIKSEIESYGVVLHTNPKKKNSLFIQFVKSDSKQYKFRSNGKVNCLPLLRGTKLTEIIKLISQPEPIKTKSKSFDNNTIYDNLIVEVDLKG